MKTLFATLLVAVAIGACSSDDSTGLTATTVTTQAQGGPCKTSADCDTPLTCGFALTNGSSCNATGICIAMGPCSVLPVCACGKTTPTTSACITETYSPIPIAACSGSTTPSDAGGGGATTGG